MSILMKIMTPGDELQRVINFVEESTDFMLKVAWPKMETIKAHAEKHPVYGIVPDEFFGKATFAKMEAGFELSLTMAEIAGQALKAVAKGKNIYNIEDEVFEALSSMVHNARSAADFLYDCMVDYSAHATTPIMQKLSDISSAGSIGIGLLKPARAQRDPKSVKEQYEMTQKMEKIKVKSKKVSNADELMELLKEIASDAHDCDNCDKAGNCDVEEEARAIRAQLLGEDTTGKELPGLEDIDMNDLAESFGARLMKDDTEEEDLKNGKAPE